MPPPEFERPESIPTQPITVNNRKHYKLIFIKAPSNNAAPIVEVPAQNEEKTIVYVLSKKPEPFAQIPYVEPPKIESKPEVRAINYFFRVQNLIY